jgi:transcriptional regulator with XRE-family HTH domain
MKTTMKAKEVRAWMAKAALGILQAKGLSLRDIATRAGLPFRSVYRWAKGETPHDMGLSKLWRLVRKVGGKT